MLLVTLTSIDDQVAADRMRRVAVRMHAAAPFTEWAVDEAVSVYRETGDMGKAINAGVEFLHRVFSAPQGEHGPGEDTPPPPFAWVESWPSIAAGLVIGLVIVVASASGMLS